jgi:hypothetical protein
MMRLRGVRMRGRMTTAALAFLTALLALGWFVDQASAVSPTVTCTPSSGTLDISISNGTSGYTLTITTSSGDYVITLNSTSECSGDSDSTNGTVDVTNAEGVPVTFEPGTDTGIVFKGAPSVTNTLDASGVPEGVTFNLSSGTLTAGGLLDEFTGIQDFTGSTAGGSEFIPKNAGGFVFKGQGENNLLDASGLSSGVTFATGTMSSQSLDGQPDLFTGIQIFEGSAGGDNDFEANPTTGGLTFEAEGSGNLLDASTANSGVTVNAAAGSMTGPFGEDFFSGIGTFKGSGAGGNTFEPGPEAGLTFDGEGQGNRLNAASSPPGATFTVNPGQMTDANGTIVFADISTFDGSSAGSSTFWPDTTGGLTFNAAGSGNVLNASGVPSGATFDPSADTLTWSGSTDDFSGIETFIGSSAGGNTFKATNTTGLTFNGAGSGNTLTAAGISLGVTFNVTAGTITDPLLSDHFTAIQTFDGPSGGATTFQPGTTKNLSFNGSGTGNTLDLSGESGSSFSSFTVAMAAASPCAGAGEITSAGSAGNLADCFAGIGTVNGASAVPTDFQPNPNLTSSGAMTFVGNDANSGGSVVDLTAFKSPDSGADTVSGLTVSPSANTESNPGSVSGQVSGDPVSFTSFYGATNVTGSSSLTTSLNPGPETGMAFTDVVLAPQVITFDSSVSGVQVGQSYTPAATGGGSGQALTFTIDPGSTPGACSLSGSTVVFVRAGACVIDANQAGSSEYQPANQAQQAIQVAAAPTSTPTSNPTPTPTPSGATPTPQVVIHSTKLLDKGGVTRIKISCPTGETFCEGTLTIDSLASIAFGTAHFDLAGGQTAVIKIKLDKKARKALKRKSPVTVTITAKAHDQAGTRATSTATAKLKLVKNHGS